MTATFYLRHGLASGAKTYLSSMTETLPSKDSNRQATEERRLDSAVKILQLGASVSTPVAMLVRLAVVRRG
jgi:hypothetical protein